MSDEGYKLQISAKVGNTMGNVRADDVEELAMMLVNLRDSDDATLRGLANLFDDELGDEERDGGSKKKKPKSRSKKSHDDDEDEDDEDEDDEDDDDDENDDPATPAQKKFAKQLKIKGYAKMSKSELSDAIDAKTKRRKR